MTEPPVALEATRENFAQLVLENSRRGLVLENQGGARVKVKSVEFLESDVRDLEVVETIVVGTAPSDLDVSPDGDRLWVANALSDNLSVVDSDVSSVTHLEVLATVGTGSNPRGVSVGPDGAIVYVGGLGVDSLSNSITFANAHTDDFLSDPDGDGVSDTITRAAQVELAQGQEIPVTLEFYVSDRTTVPDFDSYGSYFGSLDLQPPSGGSLIPVRSPRYVNGEFLVEFLTESGFTYYVQYADSLQHLADPAICKTAFPPVAGTGTYVQWIDNGPPKTASPPGDGMRFYQVIRSP